MAKKAKKVEDAVIVEEITAEKAVVAKNDGNVASGVTAILDGAKTKKNTTAIEHIMKNGTINLNGISENEKKELEKFATKLDENDRMSVINYGSELSSQLNASTKELMSMSHLNKFGDETDEIMKDITSKLTQIDLDDIKRPNALVRLIRRTPILKKLMFSVEKILNKYQGLEEQVEKMENKLQAARVIAIRNNTELEQRFQETSSYIQVLEKLIIAAKLKEEDYKTAIMIMENQPDQYSALQIHNAKMFHHELEKKITDMLTWHLSFGQYLFRIRDIQDANIASSNSIQSMLDNMMPQLRQQLHEAVVLYQLEQGVKAEEVLINGFNDILKHNADATHDMKVRITKMTEETPIKIETLRHNQQRLMDTNKEVLQIIADAKKARAEQEKEMARMEIELNKMMLNAGQGKIEEVSAKSIEAKYAN